jgi:predicted NAD/FAD-binding protein
LLNEAKCGKAFRQYFLYPMSGAIWSTTPEAMDSYPAISFLNFMINHRMLDPLGQPIWRTVVGGSKHYVNAIGEQGGFRRFKSSPVTALKRIEGGVKVIAEHVLDEVYDEVIVATHSDQALKMLTDPSKAERQVLGGVTYQPNEAVLHKDITAMPPNTRAWAAWNVVVDKVARDKVELTYDMNRLQHIEGDPCLVTLNPYRDIDPNKVVKTMSYMHPFFDISTLKSQLRWSEISGVDRIHYCGAYWKWGFHEDGLWSAMRVVDQLMLKDKVEQKSA